MLAYAGRTHAEILDALPLTDQEWDEIEATATAIKDKPAPIVRNMWIMGLNASSNMFA